MQLLLVGGLVGVVGLHHINLIASVCRISIDLHSYGGDWGVMIDANALAKECKHTIVQHNFDLNGF